MKWKLLTALKYLVSLLHLPGLQNSCFLPVFKCVHIKLFTSFLIWMGRKIWILILCKIIGSNEYAIQKSTLLSSQINYYCSLKRLQTSHYYRFNLRQSKALKIHQGFCSRLNGLCLYYAICMRVRQWWLHPVQK